MKNRYYHPADYSLTDTTADVVDCLCCKGELLASAHLDAHKNLQMLFYKAVVEKVSQILFSPVA